MQADPGESGHHAAERDEIRALFEATGSTDLGHAVRGGGPAELVLLFWGQRGERIVAPLQGHERLRDGGVELRADVPLDLGQRLLGPEACAVRAVARHRVEAVGDDEEVGGERLVLRRDPVVAPAVEALPVVLDCARLSGGELEAPEQAGRQPRRAPDRAPLRGGELPGLSEHGGVDRDLAEVVQPGGPAQPVDVGVGEPERARQRVDVAGDADGMPVGVRVALVDDVGERLEGVERLLPRTPNSRLRLVDGQRDGHDGEHVPGVAEARRSPGSRRGPSPRPQPQSRVAGPRRRRPAGAARARRAGRRWPARSRARGRREARDVR